MGLSSILYFMAHIIDGKLISQKILFELKNDIATFKNKNGFAPGLATIIVGEDVASKIYVNNKNKACLELGMNSFHYPLPVATTEAQLLHLIDSLNQNREVHGILVQLPLPALIDAKVVLEAVSPAKDVDGFHPINVGRLMLGRAGLRPCTPSGILRLLSSIGYDLAGKKVVVLGRSNIVGKPVSLMLLEAHATVTIGHSRTKNIDNLVRNADVVVAALGKPNFVKGDWIKEGSVVIDVGINRLADGKITGDVDFKEVQKKAAWITPVPGGVGPMTIAMLMQNTLEAAENAQTHPTL